jgi:DNA-binding NarL/FixJ family response regulator
MTRVLVAAPSSVIRAGLEAIVRTDSSMEVVGSTTDLQSVTRQSDELRPDVVLLELERGIDPVPAPPFGARSDLPALVLLADDPDGAEAVEALRFGARAVLPRDAQPEEILTAIQAAAAGLVVLHLEAAGAVVPRLGVIAHPASNGQGEALTAREIEVLGMLAEGAGNKNIARRLGISEHTVKFHVGSILSKLNASSRTEAVTIGIRQGLILV